jgi:hypothetical protein
LLRLRGALLLKPRVVVRVRDESVKQHRRHAVEQRRLKQASK